MKIRALALGLALACGLAGTAEAKKKPAYSYKVKKYKAPKRFKPGKIKHGKMNVRKPKQV